MQINRFAITITGVIDLVVGQSPFVVETASILQEIDGFGVSQAFGKASDFEALAAGPRQLALDYLFNTTTGAGLSIIRNRIGSGSTGDCIAPASPGSPSAAPTYVWDADDRGQVWFSQAAMSYGVSKIYADAWSAPGYMKTNGDEANGGHLCGVTAKSCSSGDWRQPYANMLAQYIKYYQLEGITITQIGFLNEPDFQYTYSAMLSDGKQAASFIPILYDTLKSAGLSGVGITCCDAAGWESQKVMTAQLVSAGMEKYLSHITSHGYTSEPTNVLNTTLKIWLSENADIDSASCSMWYSSGATCEGLTWARNIYTGMTAANLSAYFYWEGLEVNETNSSAHLIDSDGINVTPSGRLWALAMWSRFIRPGAHRVAITGTVSGVEVAAFQNPDGNIAVVATNVASMVHSITINFDDFAPLTTIAYLTDNSHLVALTTSSLSGGAVTVSVPAHSVVTIKVIGDSFPASPTSITNSSLALSAASIINSNTAVSLTTITNTTNSSNAPTSTYVTKLGLAIPSVVASRSIAVSGGTVTHWVECSRTT